MFQGTIGSRRHTTTWPPEMDSAGVLRCLLVSHAAEDVGKGVSLPLVLFGELGRRRQFVGPLKRADQASYRAHCHHSGCKHKTISVPRNGWRLWYRSAGDLGSLFMIRGVGKTWGTSYRASYRAHCHHSSSKQKTIS